VEGVMENLPRSGLQEIQKRSGLAHSIRWVWNERVVGLKCIRNEKMFFTIHVKKF
jgi:hypothetical protein